MGDSGWLRSNVPDGAAGVTVSLWWPACSADALPTCDRRDDTMSMPRAKHFTADDVRAMPDDGNRYEVEHGELLVTPAPRGVTHSSSRRT